MSALRNAIIAHLKADADIVAAVSSNIWPGVPPEKAASYPFITVLVPNGESVLWAFQTVAFEEGVFLVKAVDRSTSPGRAAEIKALIRASLNLAPLEIPGYANASVMLVHSISYPEVVNGTIYQHEGGAYSLGAAPE